MFADVKRTLVGGRLPPRDIYIGRMWILSGWRVVVALPPPRYFLAGVAACDSGYIC